MFIVAFETLVFGSELFENELLGDVVVDPLRWLSNRKKEKECHYHRIN